jgi:sugar O-acyltransferase (sialic acid O-acetyltransferase NeuD family)
MNSRTAKAQESLVIIGAGGFGREVLWTLRRLEARRGRWNLLGFCDDAMDAPASPVDGVPMLGPANEAVVRHLGPAGFICAVGDNAARKAVAERVQAWGWTPVTLIDPSVEVGPGVEVGAGTFVGVGSILSPHCCLGAHALINQHCTIGHDSVLGDFCQVSPGGRISGDVRLGTGAYVGSNGVVQQGVVVGEWAVVAAASFALVPVPARTTVAGNPARRVFRQQP